MPAESITPEELKALMSGVRKPLLLDVRRKADFDAAPKKIESAVWCDPEKADEWSAEIPRDLEVVVYCVKGGSVSRSTADKLRESHGNVRFLEGGLKAWADLGEPVED